MVTFKSGVMKSGKGLIDGTEFTLKLTPDLLLYDSPEGEHGSRSQKFKKVTRVVKNAVRA